jgi:hypothetical protein
MTSEGVPAPERVPPDHRPRRQDRYDFCGGPLPRGGNPHIAMMSTGLVSILLCTIGAAAVQSQPLYGRRSYLVPPPYCGSCSRYIVQLAPYGLRLCADLGAPSSHAPSAHRFPPAGLDRAPKSATWATKIAKHHRNLPLTAARLYKPGALLAHAEICAGTRSNPRPATIERRSRNEQSL